MANRVGYSISFDEETAEIVKEIMASGERGLLSKLCRGAVREWKGDTLDLATTKKKMLRIEAEQQSLENKKQFFGKRIEELSKQEKQKEKEGAFEERRLMEAEKEREDYTLKSTMAWFLTYGINVNEVRALSMAKDYLEFGAKEGTGMAGFLEKEGIEFHSKKLTQDPRAYKKIIPDLKFNLNKEKGGEN